MKTKFRHINSRLNGSSKSKSNLFQASKELLRIRNVEEMLQAENQAIQKLIKKIKHRW